MKTVAWAVPVGLSGTSLAVNSLNYRTNSKRYENAQDYQEKQLEAINRLTRELSNTSKDLRSLDNSMKIKREETTPPKRRSFLGNIFK